MKKILFVCVENSNRSQMAEAFAVMHGKEIVKPFSAGSKPSGRINEKAIRAMKEKGYDLSWHHSKSIEEILSEISDGEKQFDFVITMGCGDDCPYVKSVYREDWNIPDPREMNADAFNSVRDNIEKEVLKLLNKIKTESQKLAEKND